MKKAIHRLLILTAFLYFYNANCKSMETKVEEIWKDVDGYNGLYQVSNLGRVKSNQNKGYEFLKSFLKKKGYLQYFLYNKQGKRSQVTAHRLVATHFIPNPNNLPQVNHKNGIKSDNTVGNLEWISNLENTRHSYRVLGRKNDNSYQKKTVYQLSFDGFLIGVFHGVNDAMKETGIGHIDAVCRGLRKSAGGYKWTY